MSGPDDSTVNSLTNAQEGRARYVSAMPTQIALRAVAKNDVTALPFDDRPTIQTSSGRVAIYQGIKALGLAPGAAVLVPAYACGSEIDAVLKAGLKVVFYPMLKDLQPDLEACRTELARNPNIRALFITHYFGFSQPLVKLRHFADENELFMIEDCAHGFLSNAPDGTPLGRTGDFGIFSYMKSLPLTDGGACVLNRSDLTFERSKLEPPKTGKLIGRFLFQVELSLKKKSAVTARLFNLAVRGPVQLLKGALRTLKGRPKNVSVTSTSDAPMAADNSGEMEILALNPARANWSMSWLARATMARLDLEDIVAIRRRNYQRLADGIRHISGVRALFMTLPDGTCPLFFPIALKDANSIQKQLDEGGVGTKYFWSYFHDIFPREQFPFETELKESVLVLPVHQDLQQTDIDRILKVLTQVMSKRSAK